MSLHTHRTAVTLRRLIVCSLLLIGLGRTAWSQERAPGLVLRQITSDGKSSTDRGTGFAPAGDHISFYKQVSKSDRQLWLASGDGSQAQAISPYLLQATP